MIKQGSNLLSVFKIIITIFLLIFTLEAKEQLLIGSGLQGKGYHTLAKSIKKILNDNNASINLKVLSTSGSIDNLIKLRNDEIDMAIVQNDTAFLQKMGNLYLKITPQTILK